MSIDHTFGHLLDAARSDHVNKASALHWRGVLTTTFKPLYDCILGMDRTVCARYGHKCGVTFDFSHPHEDYAYLVLVIQTPKDAHRIVFRMSIDRLECLDQCWMTATASDMAEIIDGLQRRVADLFKQFVPKN